MQSHTVYAMYVNKSDLRVDTAKTYYALFHETGAVRN